MTLVCAVEICHEITDCRVLYPQCQRIVVFCRKNHQRGFHIFIFGERGQKSASAVTDESASVKRQNTLCFAVYIGNGSCSAINVSAWITAGCADAERTFFFRFEFNDKNSILEKFFAV